MSGNAARGSRCLQLAYLNRSDATDAKRRVRRNVGIETEIVYCPTCEKIHLRCETWPPVRRWRDILILMGRGFRCREISRTLGMSYDSVSWAIKQMLADWHALSQAHLITIVTSFGVLKPDDFMLLDEDLARYRPRDNKKVTYTDAV